MFRNNEHPELSIAPSGTSETRTLSYTQLNRLSIVKGANDEAEPEVRQLGGLPNFAPVKPFAFCIIDGIVSRLQQRCKK
jgi:hypothetical protein